MGLTVGRTHPVCKNYICSWLRGGQILLTAYWVSLVLSVVLMIVARRGKATSADSGMQSISTREGNSYATWGVVCSALVYVFLTGLRYGIGQDYFYTYIPYFRRISMDFGYRDEEIGFYALNWVVSRFTKDPTPVFLVCSVIFFGMTYAAIMRESSNPVLSVFLLFGMSYVFIFMNAMRQLTAVSVLFFSMRYIEQRNPLKFAMCVALACTFHVSSLIFLLAYWFPTLKINIPICLLSVLGVSILRNQVAAAINAIISRTIYAGYIGSVFDNGRTGNVIIAINIVVLLFSALMPRLYGKEYTQRYRFLLWCQLICTLVSILSGAVPLSQRVRWVFALPSIVLLPHAIDSIEDKRLRFLVQLSTIVLYIIYIAITIGLWNGNRVVPYRSVFSRSII